MSHGPCLFICNIFLEPYILWYHWISVLVVVLNSIILLGSDQHPTNHPEFFITNTRMCTISGHAYHDIVFLFHSKDMKRQIANISAYCTHDPHWLSSEVRLYLVTIDIVWPVLPLIHESSSRNALIFYIHQLLQDIETITKPQNFPVLWSFLVRHNVKEEF